MCEPSPRALTYRPHNDIYNAVNHKFLVAIPIILWTRAKAKAESEGRSLRFIVIALLTRYVKEGLKL